MPQTPAQVKIQQQQQAERDTATRKAALRDPPKTTGNGQQLALPAKPAALVILGDRSDVERKLDEVQPEFSPPAIVYDGKEACHKLASTGEHIDPQRRFIAHIPGALIERTKFNGEGEMPTVVSARLSDPTSVLPSRESLGDADAAEWPISKLTGKPEDPWKLGFRVPLQDAETLETFAFRTMSPTGRTAVSTLIRNFERARRTKPEQLPIIQLGSSSYQHKVFGRVNIPQFNIVGHVSTSKPDTLAADISDEIPGSNFSNRWRGRDSTRAARRGVDVTSRFNSNSELLCPGCSNEYPAPRPRDSLRAQRRP